MIGPGGLLLVVPHVYAISVLLVGLPKKTAKLRQLILLSRVTYWAPLEMLLWIVRKIWTLIGVAGLWGLLEIT
jgi:hypothetical protein